MKITYINEGVFGSYKNKDLKTIKSEILNQQSEVARKKYADKIAEELAEPYRDMMLTLDKKQKSKWNNEMEYAFIAYDFIHDETPKTLYCGALYEYKNGTFIIYQPINDGRKTSGSGFWFNSDEEFLFFDELEKKMNSICEVPVKIVLRWFDKVNGSLYMPWHFNSEKDGLEYNFTAYAKSDTEYPKEMIVGSNITSMTPVIRFINRFENIPKEIDRICLNYSDDLKDLHTDVLPKGYTIRKIAPVWGCVNLHSLDGYEKWMSKNNPRIYYNINGIFDNTSRDPHALRPTYIERIKNMQTLPFEDATDGAINVNDLIQMKEEHKVGRNYNTPAYIEYNIMTGKVNYLFTIPKN